MIAETHAGQFPGGALVVLLLMMATGTAMMVVERRYHVGPAIALGLLQPFGMVIGLLIPYREGKGPTEDQPGKTSYSQPQRVRIATGFALGSCLTLAFCSWLLVAEENSPGIAPAVA